MGARNWGRSEIRQHYVSGGSHDPGDATVLALVTGNQTVNDTLVRVILDLRATITYDYTGLAPEANWWSTISFPVGVGNDDPRTPTPLTLQAAHADPRITGTGTLTFRDLNTSVPPADGQVAGYSLSQVIDTHGQRRSELTWAEGPVGNVTVQGINNGRVLPLFASWTLDFIGYARFLWETP